MLDQDIDQILFTEEALRARVRALAALLNRDYAGKSPLLVGVLRGAFVFMADLIRELSLPVTMDFIAASSYGSSTISSGQLNIIKDLSEDIAGKDVILIEDILDSGNTLSNLLTELQRRNPASLKLCVLLDKPERRAQPVTADYVGFSIPDAFVVGYGLDFAEKYRNLPYIGILKPSVYI